MNVRKLLNDDRAVSPVIGVILMVAITVILAAVIGTFVLGLGDQVSQTTPNTSFGFDYDRDSTNDSLVISHNGGDTLDSSEVDVSVSGASHTDDANLNTQYIWSNLSDSSGDISAGSSATVSASNLNTSLGESVTELDLTGATVRVVWQSSEGDSSAQIGRWDGPDA